jgi:hypothetical protein
MSTHFFVTLLGRRSKPRFNLLATWRAKVMKVTRPILSNQANISQPTSNDELPKEVKQQVEAKFYVILKAFHESCTKDRWEKANSLMFLST